MVSATREKFDAFPHKLNHMRMSLDHLRTHVCSFDIPKLASQCGTTSTVIYRALLRQPVEHGEAMAILSTISEQYHIDPPLTLADIDIPIYDELHILHLAHASGSQDSEDDFALVYAKDEEQARSLLKYWITPLSATHSSITVTPVKYGIPLFGGERIPGHRGKAK